MSETSCSMFGTASAASAVTKTTARRGSGVDARSASRLLSLRSSRPSSSAKTGVIWIAYESASETESASSADVEPPPSGNESISTCATPSPHAA